MTLAELLERHGETEQALVVLQPVYDWFTEGFDTNDLQAAARILARLANSPTPRAPVLPTAPDAPAAGMFRTAS
jgi:hypothetical protein